MLQFLAQPENNYSIPEQCQMVIEGGCGWIQLHLPDADEAEIRELCTELVPLCRETSTILMLEDRPELARELGLHGVHLTAGSGLDARHLREELGAEAIIGVEVGGAASILALKGADIDYATLKMPLNRAKTVIADAAAAGNVMPVVIAGNFTVEDIPDVMQTGAAGILTAKSIVNSDDPVLYTEKLLSALRS